MKVRAVPIFDLLEEGRWRANLHVHLDSEIKSDKFEMIPLGEVVIESKVAKYPNELSSREFYYIGLEHIESITGDPLNISLVTPEQVRSRSKVFEEGDILYGRLRPYLRKVYYVEKPFTRGLCSTEFIVMKARSEVILPLFLRELLVSDAVTKLITRLQSGAALPRVSAKDLLKLKIPIPPLTFQKEIVSKIKSYRKQRHELLLKAKTLAKKSQKIIEEVF